MATNVPSNNLVNKATDFILPNVVIGDGTIDMLCEMKLKPYLSTNKNSIYRGLADINGNASYSTTHSKVGPGTYNINIPRSWFNRDNASVLFEVSTGDKDNKFISGSFAHSVLLYSTNTKYKNYLSNFLFPLKIAPGEICTLNILPPKDKHPDGVVYDVNIKYHKTIDNEYVGRNLSEGKFDFVCPILAINTSMSIYVQTKNKKTGKLIGTICHSVEIAETPFNNPEIIFPEDYVFTLSEGVNTKFRGPSTDINDYMVIYAKRQCDVIKAVSEYNTSDSYYAASKTQFKNELLEHITGDPEYYVLKEFDAPSTFITQDENERNTFHIRTPATNNYQSFDEFYALQWFKNVAPGDAIYLYVIGRRREEFNSSEQPKTRLASQVTTDSWKCDHCQANNYRYWNINRNWNPHTRFPLNNIKSIINSNYESSLKLQITMDRQLNYPPKIYITNTNSNDETGAVYLTPTSQGPSNVFDYVVPINYVRNQLANGKTYLYFHTHWGQNTNLNQAYYNSGVVSVYIKEDPVDPLIDTTFFRYSDYNFDRITQIPVSNMTPYIVLPPAVRPVELTVDEQATTTKQLTLDYTNPLYNIESSVLDTYEELGSMFFDVSNGDDTNDYSDLNESDYTLDLNKQEERHDTYEKEIRMSQDLIDKIKKIPTDNVYMDLNIASVNNKNINFVPIVDNDIKLQIMFSNNGKSKTRIMDLTTNIIDLMKQQYDIKKIYFNKSLLSTLDFNTVHLLYNINEYDRGKAFATENWAMRIDEERVIQAIGLRKYGTKVGTCSFTSNTFDVSRFAILYDTREIRLCLENMSADKELYAAPKMIVRHRNGETQLSPTNLGVIKPGEDIIYNVPREIYDVMYDEVVTYTMSPTTPYPTDMPDIEFSNAYIEVIGKDSMEEIVDKFAPGFTANLKLYQLKKQTTSANTPLFDPIQCLDVILCCYDEAGKLINRTATKRRDIYNGKSFIYYSDRKWHNFFNGKYKNNTKYKQNYKMTFNIPEGTMHIYAMAFNYGNWHDNPSIYSMSNVVSISSVKQDLSLEFLSPRPEVDLIDPNLIYSNVNNNNPTIKLRLNAKQNNVSLLDEVAENRLDLANSVFNMDTWLNNPLVYSNNKQYGYEQPVFNAIDLYRENSAVNALEPLYNSIEYYSRWSKVYGTELIESPKHDEANDIIDVQSNYTVYEDEGEKYISNKAVPYVEIPANLVNFDRSYITLFLDADFGVNQAAANTTKVVTETYTETYKMTQIRSGVYGVKTLWTKNLMTALGDVASIEDIKIEWGMKVSNRYSHPTAGRPGPTLVEDLWYEYTKSVYYWYNPATTYPNECTGARIRDYGGNKIKHKRNGSYIYFEITNPRIKRLFLQSNCQERRFDPIIFENLDGAYYYWDTNIKVKFTIKRRVYEDGSSIYKQQNLPAENFNATTPVPGWAVSSKPHFKFDNIRFEKAPTESDPTFTVKYDVYLSPITYYYKSNPTKGDSLGNIYKYSWGDSEYAYMKWETVTFSGTTPYSHKQDHYYVAYDNNYSVKETCYIDVDGDGDIIQK